MICFCKYIQVENLICNNLIEISLGTQGITFKGLNSSKLWHFQDTILVYLLQHVVGLLQRLVGLLQNVVGLLQRLVGLLQHVVGLLQRLVGLLQHVVGLLQHVVGDLLGNLVLCLGHHLLTKDSLACK